MFIDAFLHVLFFEIEIAIVMRVEGALVVFLLICARCDFHSAIMVSS